MKFLLLHILLLFFYTSLFAQNKELKISFVSPHHDDGRFWYLAHDFAKEVSKDLKIDLKIYYNKIEGDRFTYLDAYKRAFNEKIKPDFIVGTFMRNISKSIFEMSEKFNIPIFIVNTSVPNEEKSFIGEPRAKHKNFIGHMYPDEKYASYILADYLINKSKKNKLDKKIEIVGITGNKENPVAINRKIGLEKASKINDTTLHQTIFTNWTVSQSREKTKRLLKRYKNLDVFWYVNDDTALAGNKIIKKLKKNIVVGGFDWEKEAIESIKNGTYDASVGGHFVEVGFALILLYDYYHGKDFYVEFGSEINTKMQLITSENIDTYYNFLNTQDWGKIDFRKYSKSLNQELKKYNFEFKTLLEKY